MTTLPLDPYIAVGGEFHNPTSPGENAYAEPPLMRSFAAAIRSEIGSTVPPPPDLSNFYTKSQSDARFEQFTNKAVASGYAPLDAAGLVPTVHIPPLAINDTFVVASEAAMLALTAQRGDMAIRTDTGRTYVLSAEPASTLANWKEVLAAGQVTSVNGKTGVVNLTATDVGAYTKAESDAKYALIGASYTKAESDAKYSLIGHNHDAAYLPIGTPIPPPTHITSTNGSVTIVESPTGTFDLAAAGGSGGSVTVLRDEEFAPAAAATTVTLAATPTDIHTVTRNGVVQSVAAGHYTVAGAVLTFSDAFVAGERVSVVYSIGTSVPVDSWTQAEADARFVNIIGDTMTGDLKLAYSIPTVEARQTTNTTSARFGQVVGQNRLDLTINARYDGTNWQRDDTTKSSSLILMSDAQPFSIYTAAAGANPLGTLNQVFYLDANGTIFSRPLGGYSLDAGNDIMLRNSKSINFANTAFTASGGWKFNDAVNAVGFIFNGSQTSTFFKSNGSMQHYGPIDIAPGAENLAGTWLLDNTGARRSYVGLEGDYSAWRVYGPSVGNALGINLSTGYASFSGGIGVPGTVTTSTGLAGNGSVLNISSTANIQLAPAGTVVHPSGDNTILLGYPTLRWSTLYTVAINSGSGQLSITGGFHIVLSSSSGGWIYHRSTGHNFFDGSAGAIVAPEIDNKLICGGTGNRWQYVAAVNGAINTCRAEEKDIVGLIDPQDALDAVLRTPIHKFHPRDGEGKANKTLTFVGQVDSDCDPRMQIGEGSWTSPNHQAGMAFAAIQALAAEVAELKAQLAARG
jgi:hypothetical protein